MDSRPRATRERLRRPSADGGASALAGAGSIAARAVRRAGFDVTLSAISSPGSALSRSGAIDLVTVVQSTRSSSESTRRPLPSRAMALRTGVLDGCACLHRADFGWSRPRQRSEWRALRAGHRYRFRHQHHEMSVLLDAPGDVLDALAVSE